VTNVKLNVTGLSRLSMLSIFCQMHSYFICIYCMWILYKQNKVTQENLQLSFVRQDEAEHYTLNAE